MFAIKYTKALWQHSFRRQFLKSYLIEDDDICHELKSELAKVCVVMAFDKKFALKIGNHTGRRNRAWAEKKGYGFLLYDTPLNGILPHFMRYSALLSAFERGYDTAVYVDADAYFTSHQIALPESRFPVTFGNSFAHESMAILNKVLRWAPNQSVINTGFILCRRHPLTFRFLNDMLEHPLCEKCRQCGCRFQGYKDQGCIDHFFSSNEFYQTNIAKFRFAQVQEKTFSNHLLLVHRAGSKRTKVKMIKEMLKNPLE